MKFFRFFVSKKFILNVISIAIVWLVVIFGTKYYLNTHTNFGEKIEVPSFYKIHMDDIDEFISSKNITYEIVDSIYMEGWPKGTVCWQHPKPTDSTGEWVKRDRVIQLSVVPLKPKMINVPNVIEKSKRMAETQLESLGLRTKVSYQPSTIGSGFVLDQKINGITYNKGMIVPVGTVIELIVARGSAGESTALPNLLGLTILQAKERLTNLTLSLHTECTSCLTPNDVDNAVIINQSPNGGEAVSVAAGTTVTVWAEK
jgi:beta-lactam-binding protein with PASTA domain